MSMLGKRARLRFGVRYPQGPLGILVPDNATAQSRFLCAVSSALEVEMSVPRTDLEMSLHRLSNFVECKLAELLPELLSEGKAAAVCDVAYSGSRFIEMLREVRDGKQEGGDE